MILAEPPRDLFSGKPSTENRLLDNFLEDFHGHFDNHMQVQENEQAGLTPREGGGHEHIHCTLIPVEVSVPEGHEHATMQHVLARYYFNGQPQAIFRERLYSFDALAKDPQFGPCVRMSIFHLRENVAGMLRAPGTNVEDVAFTAADVTDSLHVPEADVFWRWCGERFEGEMRTPTITIISERSGRAISVSDDVAFWGDQLWVNDRGCDTETGEYVYGNIHNIPYKMARVSDMHWTATGKRAEDVDTDADDVPTR